MQDWVKKELASSNLGDRRLDKRFRVVTDCLSKKPSLSIPAACNSWGETMGTYRFFDHDDVDAESVLAPHYLATLDRMNEHEVVLLVQDTTEIDLTRPDEKVKGAGPLNDESRLGVYDHVTLAITPDGIPLGVVNAHIWARDMDEFLANKELSNREKEYKRRKTPFEEKESFRWFEGYQRGCEIAHQLPDSKIVVVSDSEADIFECFVDVNKNSNADWIIRACQDRSVKCDKGNGQLHLREQVASTEVLGTMEVDVSKRLRAKDDSKRNQSRSARTAKMTIQATTATLRGVKRPKGALADVQINLVLVTEIDPPKGEEPIEWLLLTSLPITSFKKVCLSIDYYCHRWQIEIYYRVLKSGCRVEQRQLETIDRFQPCLALYMIVAWRVMYVLMMGREHPDMPSDEIFSDDEWKSVYTITKKEKPPKDSPTLEEVVYMIASLGGHLGRKHDGPPGPKVMWVGLQRMADLAAARRAFAPQAEKRPARERKCV